LICKFEDNSTGDGFGYFKFEFYMEEFFRVWCFISFDYLMFKSMSNMTRASKKNMIKPEYVYRQPVGVTGFFCFDILGIVECSYANSCLESSPDCYTSSYTGW